jgi:foldase protein PrsA
MLKVMLKSGANFSDLAHRYSCDLIDPGGDLGIMHADTKVNRDILEVALTLKKGEYSQPLRSFFGYELVYVSSTDADHPKEEDALYAEARYKYRIEQLDRWAGSVRQKLDAAAHVTIYYQPQ